MPEVKVTICCCFICGRWSASPEQCHGRTMKLAWVPVMVEPGLLNAAGQLRDAKERIRLQGGLLAARELARAIEAARGQHDSDEARIGEEISDAFISHLRDLLATATPGPYCVVDTLALPPSCQDHEWRQIATMAGGHQMIMVHLSSLRQAERSRWPGPAAPVNAKLFVRARNLLPRLLDEIEASRRRLAEVNAWFEESPDASDLFLEWLIARDSEEA